MWKSVVMGLGQGRVTSARNPMWMGEARGTGASVGGGAEAWARWGEVPATVLASGGRGMRRRHLQAASLAKVGLGAGGQV